MYSNVIIHRTSLPHLVHRQDPQRKRERDAPEHARDRRRPEHGLQPGPVQVHDGHERRRGHTRGDREVPARAPEGVGLEDRDAAVADCEEAAVVPDDTVLKDQ